jgi:pteridine reductase
MKKTALITGAAKRIGAVIAETLHHAGYQVAIHCNNALDEANALTEKLNALRENSAMVCDVDLRNTEKLPVLIQKIIHHWGRLDVLVNNASGFYPTDLTSVTTDIWDDLMNANAKAPFFLSQAAYPHLKATQGHIVNITDIHAENPLRDYGIYSMSKALLWNQTRCLAKEWGPEIRVNAVAPGSVLWPEGVNVLTTEKKQKLIHKTPLKKQVTPESIANAVLFLLQSDDITGEAIHVSAGRL